MNETKYISPTFLSDETYYSIKIGTRLYRKTPLVTFSQLNTHFFGKGVARKLTFPEVSYLKGI